MLFNYRYKDDGKWQYKFKGKSLFDNKSLATDLHKNGYEIERGTQDYVGEMLITKWEPWIPFNRVQLGGHHGISYALCVKVFNVRYGNKDKTFTTARDIFKKLKGAVTLRTIENIIYIINSGLEDKLYYQAFREWKDDNPDIETDLFVPGKRRRND